MSSLETTVLVTGGAGFIGSNFLLHSVRRHPRCRFVNLDKLTYAGNLRGLEALSNGDPHVFVRGDVADATTLDDVFERYRPSIVVHFAAESHVDRSILGPADFVRTNIEGTFQLLEACRRHFPRGEGLFHHVSTDEVFGSLGETGAFHEGTPYDPSSPYSASKAASDHLVRAYHRTYGLPIKITNCSNNYGPRQFPEKLVPLMIMNALEGRELPIYGEGKNVRDWLYVDDHCDAIWAVIERGRVGETYVIGGRAERRNVEVVELVARLVAEETGVAPETILERRRFVADRPGHDHRYAIDPSKIERELGWRPRESFVSGMKKTVRWYLENEAWVDEVRTGEYRRWIEANYGRRGGEAA
ncbi:MAG: dTDP-glucose 4,6-dehydratase [Myxococcales bacterium]|nr:dTDP-glucose 4,6-dehydratase [Myxococcales bacterium]